MKPKAIQVKERLKSEKRKKAWFTRYMNPFLHSLRFKNTNQTKN